jgi:hypothetical protein
MKNHIKKGGLAAIGQLTIKFWKYKKFLPFDPENNLLTF